MVNLFQNDSWIVKAPNNLQFKARFGTQKADDDFIINAYKNLMISIRQNNPKATIICALGNMDTAKKLSKWPNLIKLATTQLEDEKVYNLVLPFENYGGHPKRVD
jgi:hypothetical protein